MDKLRMKGKGTHGIVWIGILPCPCHGGVVDRKNLNYIHTGSDSPIDKLRNVMELAYSETLLRTE